MADLVPEPKNFEPKVPIKLDPPRSDPISVAKLALQNGMHDSQTLPLKDSIGGGVNCGHEGPSDTIAKKSLGVDRITGWIPELRCHQGHRVRRDWQQSL